MGQDLQSSLKFKQSFISTGSTDATLETFLTNGTGFPMLASHWMLNLEAKAKLSNVRQPCPSRVHITDLQQLCERVFINMREESVDFKHLDVPPN